MSDINSLGVAIVTGASSGIGEATTRRLARAGYKVVAAARRIERLEKLSKELAQEGAQALPAQIDLAREEQTQELIDLTLKTWGRVDLLVNNAGYSPASATEQIKSDELLHIFSVNLLSHLQLISKITPVMREQGSGRIINLGSMAGSVAAPLAVPYAATKAGIEAATQCLRLELAPWNIQLSVIIPGFVATEAIDSARERGETLRQDENNPYRSLMFSLDHFALKQLERALQPDDVAKTIEKAALATRPKARYFAPRHARLQRGFMGLLPDTLRERILMRMYGG